MFIWKSEVSLQNEAQTCTFLSREILDAATNILGGKETNEYYTTGV